MKICFLIACSLVFIAFATAESAGHKHKGKHHHHKGHHHHHHGKHPSVQTSKNGTKAADHTVSKPVKLVPGPLVKKVAAQTNKTIKTSHDEQFVAKMKALESRLAEKKKAQELAAEKGHLLVMGPLPADFSQRFAQAVAHATGADAKKVTVTGTSQVKGNPGVFAVDFKASPKIVKVVESEAADSDSKLAQGNLHSFLVAKDDADEDKKGQKEDAEEVQNASPPATPVEEKGVDIDTAMPYGELEPFGREDTAQELTEDSISESNQMVDQLERAEVAEEKRSVFRALTRLRGAAITSFDGIARAQTGSIDEYNKIHQWRNTHPLHHLADEESDVSKWAFPDNADF